MRLPHRLRAGLALLFAAVLVTAAFLYGGGVPRSNPPAALAAAPAELAAPQLPPDQLGQWCVDRKAKGTRGLSSRARSWLDDCIALFGAGLTPAPTPTATSSPSPTFTTTAPPTTAPPTSTTTPVPTTPPATTTGPNPTIGPSVCPAWPAVPDADCTGWQHTGVTLRTCREADGEEDGHLTVTQVFDGCLMRGFFRIRAKDIVIRNSKIEGALAPHHTAPQQYMGLALIDVEITTAVPNAAPIADGNDYTCIRCHVHHTSTGIGGGFNVRIYDSYVHDMTYTDGAHHAAVGWAYGSGEIIHNNLDCSRWNVPPGPQGCSAALSLYDEGRMDGVLVKNNQLNGAGEYCAYSGGPTAKNVRFIDNRFGTKYHPRCGNSGWLHSWYPSNEGYVWQGNTLNGTPIAP